MTGLFCPINDSIKKWHLKGILKSILNFILYLNFPFVEIMFVVVMIQQYYVVYLHLESAYLIARKCSCFWNMGDEYSVVGITTRLWAGQSWVQIPVESRDFSLLWSIQTGSEAHQASYFMGKAKQSHYRPWGFENVEFPRFQDSWHMKVVKLSAISNGLPHRKYSWYSFLSETESTSRP